MYLTHTPKDSFCGIRVHHDSPHVISPKHFLASTGFSPFTKVCVGEMRMKQQQTKCQWFISLQHIVWCYSTTYTAHTLLYMYYYNTLSDVIQQHTQHTHYCICIIPPSLSFHTGVKVCVSGVTVASCKLRRASHWREKQKWRWSPLFE